MNEEGERKFLDMLHRGDEMAVAWDRDVASNDRLAIGPRPWERGGSEWVTDLLRDRCYRIVFWWPSWHPTAVVSCHMRDRPPLVFAWWTAGSYWSRHSFPYDRKLEELGWQRERTGYWELTL